MTKKKYKFVIPPETLKAVEDFTKNVSEAQKAILISTAKAGDAFRNLGQTIHKAQLPKNYKYDRTDAMSMLNNNLGQPYQDKWPQTHEEQDKTLGMQGAFKLADLFKEAHRNKLIKLIEEYQPILDESNSLIVVKPFNKFNNIVLLKYCEFLHQDYYQINLTDITEDYKGKSTRNLKMEVRSTRRRLFYVQLKDYLWKVVEAKILHEMYGVGFTEGGVSIKGIMEYSDMYLHEVQAGFMAGVGAPSGRAWMVMRKGERKPSDSAVNHAVMRYTDEHVDPRLEQETISNWNPSIHYIEGDKMHNQGRHFLCLNYSHDSLWDKDWRLIEND